MFPSRNLVYFIPSVILLGIVFGYIVDTSALQDLTLPVIVLTIYPTMVGFNLRELFNLTDKELIVMSLLINFILVPAVTYFLGLAFLLKSPGFFAGLVIASLLPTSNMTIAYTAFADGNGHAAVKITSLSLILSSLLAPWYLYFMVGRYIHVDMWMVFRTIGIVVFLPLAMGISTFRYLRKRYSMEEFNSEIKPLLPGFSTWGIAFIIFVNVSVNSKQIVNGHESLGVAILVLAVFYLMNYVLAIAASRLGGLTRADSYALVYCTGLKNLAISLGLASATFGPQAALMVSVALLFQPQAAVWLARFDKKISFLPVK